MPKAKQRPWSDSEVRALGTDTDAAIARLLGRSHKGVETARRDRGIPAFTEWKRSWTVAEARQLGRATDKELAKKFGCSRRAVLMERQKRGIPPFRLDRTRRKMRKKYEAKSD